MSAGDPMCECACGGWLGQCRRQAERTYRATDPQPARYRVPDSAELVTLKSQIAEYLKDVEVWNHASETMREAGRSGCAGVYGFLGPGLEKLRGKIERRRAWLKEASK